MSENNKLEEVINSMTKGNPSLKDLREKEKRIKDLTVANQCIWTQAQALRQENEELRDQIKTLEFQVTKICSSFYEESAKHGIPKLHIYVIPS